MTAPTKRGAYGDSATAKRQLLLEARAEWLGQAADRAALPSRHEKAQTWALRAGLSPAVVQLALCLAADDASAGDTVAALLLAIPHGAQCDTVASAWWLWLCEQGDGSALKPLRQSLSPADDAALAEPLNELHRRIVAGQDVTRGDWRRIRAALPAEPTGELAVIAAAAWDFRQTPGAVVDVVDAWRLALGLRLQHEAGLAGPAAEAMGAELYARMNAYLEGALGRPAPAEDDESEPAMRWRQAAAEHSQKFLDTYDHPLYLRMKDVMSETEAEFRALARSGLMALTRLIAPT